MKNDILVSLRLLSDAALVAGLKSSSLVSVAIPPASWPTSRSWTPATCSCARAIRSLFVYCRDALGMSEGEAYNRIEVARAARRFPVVLDMLSDGRVHLTAVRGSSRLT